MAGFACVSRCVSCDVVVCVSYVYVGFSWLVADFFFQAEDGRRGAHEWLEFRVCSSDLFTTAVVAAVLLFTTARFELLPLEGAVGVFFEQIGRASCRERVCQYV